MKISEINVPALSKPMEPFDPGYPISPRENLLRAFRHEKPLWMPHQYRSTQFALCPANQDMPRSMSSATDDWFGVQYEFSEAFGTPTPIPGMLNDITEWREKVKWPDMDDYDWDQGVDKFQRKENLALATPYGNGLFERMHMFIDFENALVDLLMEPEECKNFFMALADYKIEIFNRMYERYKFDYVIYNDDWGTANDAFFSVDTMKELLYEPTKKIFDAIHEKGVMIQFHNCGKIDRFIPYIVEDFKADALEIQSINDIDGILEKYGDRVLVEVKADPIIMNDLDKTDDEIRAYARAFVDRYGAHKHKGSGAVFSTLCNDPRIFRVFEEEVYYYSSELYAKL